MSQTLNIKIPLEIQNLSTEIVRKDRPDVQASAAQKASAARPAPVMSKEGEVLLRGVGTLRICRSSVKTLLVKCSSVQRQPDGLTIHTKQWFLGADS